LNSTSGALADEPCLRDIVVRSAGLRLDSPETKLCAADIAASTQLGSDRFTLAGKSVLIQTATQISSARAMLELDGLAARVVICPPDFTPERLDSVIEQAGIDAIVSDQTGHEYGANLPFHLFGEQTPIKDVREFPRLSTQWVLPTSGTTGAPKLVRHHLAGLLGAIKNSAPGEATPVWATFYDIRRYGGLQIFLRACSAGARLLLSESGEAFGKYLARCADAGVTHISGTPSHWRRLLMNPDAKLIAPEYIRLSGEISDGAILAALHATWPRARIVHAYASTEAGVVFEVTDGREGFPASFLGGLDDVELRITEGSLRVRSARTALCYVGRNVAKLLDAEGFVDTDDLVEIAGDRCFFRGRRSGVINIGGLKVHPEEVERVINAHDDVLMSQVMARRNPITGDLVVADVVLRNHHETQQPERRARIRDEILAECRKRLEHHKIPVAIQFVASLKIGAAGKLARRSG
jgi:acyl-coenzyme A synthetase/AMP-(fatty) acid ligase